MKINPIKIYGAWKEGYALDKHVERSIFLENDIYGNPQYDTQRTELGECLYRLKYRYNYLNAEKIAETCAEFIENTWKINDKIDGIIAVPPSKKREVQPVFEIAILLGEKLKNRPVSTDFFSKLDEREFKNLSSEEKEKINDWGFKKNKNLLRKSNILILDDLYSSGASLNNITELLKSDPNIGDIYVLAITKTR